jgi:transposase-like protein
VTETESDQVETPEEKLSSLLVDGTGYKRRPDPEAGLDNKGGLRMALGITNAGRVKVLGTWSGLSWEQIARQLAQGGSEGDKKLAGLLVTDGEPGLGEALGELTEDHQRCLWHMTHDLDDPMWRDGASKAERRATQKNLAGLLRIELPPEDGEPVASEDYQEIRRKVRQAEEEIDRLVEGLTDRGYRRAAKYVGQARDRLFSYIRFWLRYGVVNPKVTSFIERLMREVGRRLKRIAFGWRPENAAKMARLILKRITNAAEWEEYWRKRLRLEGNVIIAYLGVRSSPQESGR